MISPLATVVTSNGDTVDIISVGETRNDAASEENVVVFVDRQGRKYIAVINQSTEGFCDVVYHYDNGYGSIVLNETEIGYYEDVAGLVILKAADDYINPQSLPIFTSFGLSYDNELSNIEFWVEDDSFASVAISCNDSADTPYLVNNSYVAFTDYSINNMFLNCEMDAFDVAGEEADAYIRCDSWREWVVGGSVYEEQVNSWILISLGAPRSLFEHA